METDEPSDGCLEEFELYQTQSKFYLVGNDAKQTKWRVLKIDKTETSELCVSEDSGAYSASERIDLLSCLNDGNRPGGLQFVTKCCGIIGFIKFLGPYYMLLITERRKLGTILGQSIWGVSKSKLIACSNFDWMKNAANEKDELRYKKLLCTLDLTKNFFFSYSYNIMSSLQRNICHCETDQIPYQSMFSWNEFLTREIREQLHNTTWTVALAYGFFKQVKDSMDGRNFKLTLVARRSRHFAGTRYLKRGVNRMGRVANDVETEQIVSEDNANGLPAKISSVVQNRGSIPLSWSQEASIINARPEIILQRDTNFEATGLHFDNLVKRYGNPIIILNLIRSREKNQRESLLRGEFAKAIDYLNRNLSEENQLKGRTNVVDVFRKVAANALDLTSIFYCQVPTDKLVANGLIRNMQKGNSSTNCLHSDEIKVDDQVISGEISSTNKLVSPVIFQKGVLRTNCIDCLDRTNYGQFAYGLAALGLQLHALGFIDIPVIVQDIPLADVLMKLYEKMGDALALQYGGSPAHNKIFCKSRGQWNLATLFQDSMRKFQRHYSNVYIDPEKQNAINLFLGYFRPHQSKPALWELGSDEYSNIGRHGSFAYEKEWSTIKRSLSATNLLSESYKQEPSSDTEGEEHVTPGENSDCESDISYSRVSSPIHQHPLSSGSFHKCLSNHCLGSDCSNFLKFDHLDFPGSFKEEFFLKRHEDLGDDKDFLSLNLET